MLSWLQRTTSISLWRMMAAALVSFEVEVCTLAFLLAIAASAQAQAVPDSSKLNRSFIVDYCAKCHDAETQKGGLDLETISRQDPAAHAEAWEKVVRKLRARQMPP